MSAALLFVLLASQVSQNPMPATPPAVAVMTFNLRYGTANDGPNRWELRRDAVRTLVREQDPDVLGVQEALRFQLDALAEALLGHREIGVGRDDGRQAGEYSALFVRRERFAVEASGTFWLSDRPEEPGSITWGNACTRVCSWAHLRDRRSGRLLAVYNTHWDHRSQPSRLRAADLILRRMGRVTGAAALILTGDLNAGEDNPAVQRLLQRPLPVQGPDGPVAQPLVDTFRVRHPQARDVGTFNGFQGKVTGDKIDYVFAAGPVTVHAARILRDHVDGRYPSDHFPVVAVLSF